MKIGFCLVCLLFQGCSPAPWFLGETKRGQDIYVTGVKITPHKPDDVIVKDENKLRRWQ